MRFAWYREKVDGRIGLCKMPNRVIAQFAKETVRAIYAIVS